jgi:hypothetical protein
MNILLYEVSVQRGDAQCGRSRAILDALKVPPGLWATTTSNTVIVPAQEALSADTRVRSPTADRWIEAQWIELLEPVTDLLRQRGVEPPAVRDVPLRRSAPELGIEL